MEHNPLQDLKPMSVPAPPARSRPNRLPFLRFITYGLSASNMFDGDMWESQAATINVSEGGLCLLVNISLQEADIIRVDLPLADVSTTSATLAEVKWLKPVPWSLPEKPQYFVGVQFLL